MRGLLENILEKSNLNYISDLNGKMNEPSVKNALKELRAEDYDFKEWAEAMAYLTAGDQQFGAMEEIRNFVKDL